MRSAIAFFALFAVANASTCGLPLGIDGLFGGCTSGIFNTGLLGPARTIANTCTCTKTTVRPKYLQVVKDLPAFRRVVQHIATPVVEQQQYAASPLESTCGCGLAAPIAPCCGLASNLGSCGLASALNPCGLSSPCALNSAITPCGLASSINTCGLASPINACGLASPINTCGLASPLNACGLPASIGSCGLVGSCGLCGLNLVNGLVA